MNVNPDYITKRVLDAARSERGLDVATIVASTTSTSQSATETKGEFVRRITVQYLEQLRLVGLV